MDKAVAEYRKRRQKRMDAKREDYGVKGMKWGHHKAQTEAESSGALNGGTSAETSVEKSAKISAVEHREKTKDKTAKYKKQDVMDGKNPIYNDWSKHSSITKDQFCDAIDWLIEETPDSNGNTHREVALTENGWKKIMRSYDKDGKFAGFYDPAKNRGTKSSPAYQRWEGESFTVHDPVNGDFKSHQKISVNVDDVLRRYLKN